MRRSALLVAGTLAFLAMNGPSHAAQLLLVEQPDCAACMAFNEKVAPIYPASPAGRIAPLRRINVARRWPDDLRGIMPTHFTPVFILVDQGHEIGRIHGYSTAAEFWARLDRLLPRRS